jgi:superfamily II DNA or RNA helicase
LAREVHHIVTRKQLLQSQNFLLALTATEPHNCGANIPYLRYQTGPVSGLAGTEIVAPFDYPI